MLLQLTVNNLLLPPPIEIWIPENCCYYPPPTATENTEYGSRKMSATTPPHRIHSGKTRSAPPNGCWPVRLWVCYACRPPTTVRSMWQIIMSKIINWYWYVILSDFVPYTNAVPFVCIGATDHQRMESYLKISRDCQEFCMLQFDKVYFRHATISCGKSVFFQWKSV